MLVIPSARLTTLWFCTCIYVNILCWSNFIPIPYKRPDNTNYKRATCILATHAPWKRLQVAKYEEGGLLRRPLLIDPLESVQRVTKNEIYLYMYWLGALFRRRSTFRTRIIYACKCICKYIHARTCAHVQVDNKNVEPVVALFVMRHACTRVRMRMCVIGRLRECAVYFCLYVCGHTPP
jgi:hypothetical protein